MTQTTLYRIWLRGAFPRVMPQCIDREFASLDEATEFARRQCLKSVNPARGTMRYTRFGIHEMLTGERMGPQLASGEFDA